MRERSVLGWWTGVLFAVGSICFAVGAAPGYVDAVGVDTDAVTFFVGSLFFTVAAGLQCWEAAHAPAQSSAAALVQLAGTVLFNLSTYDALSENLSAHESNRLVWTPDALGSICFLVASGLAWAEIGEGWWSWHPRDRSWRIAALNLAGSIAFGASAVASHVVPASDQPRNVALMNLGTFVGALCFLAGAIQLLPGTTCRRERPAAWPLRGRS